MADAVKAQKLAAARRRLKEYQKTQTKKVIKNDEHDQENVDPSQIFQTSSEVVTPAESMVSSTHSILDPIIQENVFQNQELLGISEAQPTSELFVDNNTNANFFNNALFQRNENNHLLGNYFDNVSNTHNIAEMQTNVNFIESESDSFTKNQNLTYADPFDSPENQNFVPTQMIHAADSEQMNSENERQKSESALQENQNSIFSNTESLRQLSSQLNSLIDSESAQNVTGVSGLETRNQELASLLKNEQLKTEQLNLQLREYSTRVTQLETECQLMKNECDAKLSREMAPLQEQLQYHIQTVGILVGEKTELTMALNQSQATAKQKTSECEELQGRLKASRHRVSELEKEVGLLKSTKENFDKNEQENNREFERFRLEYNLLKEQCQEMTEESSELREKLNAKINECQTLQQEMQEKNSQLSLTQLKVQQLTNGENVQIESQLEVLNQQKISLEQQITELTQTVKLNSAEREQASQQYQQYVQQLNGQIQTLAESLETRNIENDNLSKREQSFIKHIGELEKHLQHLQNERQTFVPNDNENEIKNLEDMLESLRNEHSELQVKYTEGLEKLSKLSEEAQQRDEIILELETKIEHMTDQPDSAKLLATIESDKVAASRAVEQNKKLKEQLQELHDGFIKMSNSKLELTENLQSEQFQNKELSEKLSQSIAAVEHLHSVIATKDKELLEVQNRETELQKQILQHDQLNDRLRHYEAQGNASDFLQQELHRIQQEIVKLKEENEILTGKLNEKNTVKTEKISNLEINSDSKTVAEGTASENNLDKDSAMQQLEKRFKKTMIEVAELTEEKQRLEHLVLQLQSETETIGEYVTLYQCQRAMLKEKTLEKDEQLKRLSQDREDMKVKLDELNTLVQKLIIEKGVPTELLHHTLLQKHEACDIHKQEDTLEENENKDRIVNGNHDNNNENFGTAGKIITLLSEIKTSNLVQPGDSIQNFHPCPWCSGQLITV